MDSKDADEKQSGQLLAGIEYENLLTALELALAAQASIRAPYTALSAYVDATHDEARGLTLGQLVLERLEGYPAQVLSGTLGVELVSESSTISANDNSCSSAWTRRQRRTAGRWNSC